MEWMLYRDIFRKNLHLFSFEPSVDLFTSRSKNQRSHYVPYHPDPSILVANVFTNSWENFYAFPPFVIPGKELRKHRNCDSLKLTYTTMVQYGIVQYGILLKVLIDVPVFLSSSKDLLVIPTKNQKHPLSNKMNLLACLISGKNSLTRIFQLKV